MSQVELCAGCGKMMLQSPHIPVVLPLSKRTIAFVHAFPQSKPADVFPHCHRQAYLNLRGAYPMIMIADRILNAEVANNFPKRHHPTSSGESRAAKFTQMRGNPAYAIHHATRRASPIQSFL